MSGLVIVDYGMGNLWSVISALRYLGFEPVVSGDRKVVAEADTLILPGVGSFYKAMNELHEKDLVEVLKESVLVKHTKILGICLGMQLMANKGTEDGECEGLGFIPGTVERFSSNDLGQLKVPHIGFNTVAANEGSALFQGLSPCSDFYFVHSYRLQGNDFPGNSIYCRHGIEFLAGFEYRNIFATQFHPEKSQTNGLRLLSNFLAA